MVLIKVSDTPFGNVISSGIDETMNVSNNVSTRASEYVPSGNRCPGCTLL